MRKNSRPVTVYESGMHYSTLHEGLLQLPHNFVTSFCHRKYVVSSLFDEAGDIRSYVWEDEPYV